MLPRQQTSAAVVNDTESWSAGNESSDNVRERIKTFPVVERKYTEYSRIQQTF